MSVLKFNPRNAILLLFIILIAGLRLASFKGMGPLTLFTPLGAMALFGGAYFSGMVKPFLFPLLTLFISDVIVSFAIFPELRSGLLYSGWYWTYGAIALITVAGKLLIRKVTVKNIVLSIIVATGIHWLVSDIGSCLAQDDITFAFYLQRLMTAIPYELRFLAGTTLYSGLMFGSFELLQKKYTWLRLSASRG